MGRVATIVYGATECPVKDTVFLITPTLPSVCVGEMLYVQPPYTFKIPSPSPHDRLWVEVGDVRTCAE
jgi:hypothetical protein